MIKRWVVLGVLACAIGISAASWQPQHALLPFLLLSTAMLMASAVPAWRGWALSPRVVFASALALHAIALCGIPLFEDDFYRYLWDGYRTAIAGTPYGPPPEAFFADPDVPISMRRVLDGINYPETPTIYGPVLQILFWLSHVLGPGQERVLRALLCLGNLGLILLLLGRLPANRVALYAWSPLAFKEIALSGHPDGLLALALLLAHFQQKCASGFGPENALNQSHLASNPGKSGLNFPDGARGLLLGARRASVLFGACLGLAAGIKLSALAAWPALLRLRPDFRGIALGGVGATCTLALAYLPFVIMGDHRASDLAGLAAFATKWQFNAGPYAWVMSAIGALPARLVLGALALAGIAIVHMRAKATSPLYPYHAVFGCVLVASPVINPWYLLWGLPFACGTRLIWPWVASLALLLSYCSGQQLPASGLAPFAIHPAAQALEWAAILAALAFDGRRLIFPKRDQGMR